MKTKKVYVLEAVQACEDSPIMGKILAFVGEAVADCQKFMANYPDFITVDFEENPDCWKWRVTEMTVGKDTPDHEVREFWPTGKEV